MSPTSSKPKQSETMDRRENENIDRQTVVLNTVERDAIFEADSITSGSILK